MGNPARVVEAMGQHGYIVYNTLKKRYEVVMEQIRVAVIPPKTSLKWRYV
jgi:CRISPR/Cas system-associated exonuclease Cas4 (RecB family)